MQWRRTVRGRWARARLALVVAAVASIAITATVGITLLHRHAGEREARRQALIEVEASANRLSTLQWQAIAERRVSVSAQAEVEARLDRMHGELLRLQRTGGEGIAAPLAAFDRYRPAIENEYAYLRAREIAAAEDVLAADVESAFARLSDGLRRASARNAAVADRSERLAWIGSAAVIGLAALALTVLLVAAERAARRRALDDELRHLSFHDGLTGLPNRVLFEQRIREALGAGDAAVACLDLDDLKHVNDSLGHTAGDRLLEIAAQRLRHALRSEDTVARLDGDEFAVLVRGPVDAEALVRRVFGALESPVTLDGKWLRLDACLGVAVAGSGGSAVELLRDATLAMHDAKSRGGKNGYALFEDAMRVDALERRNRKEELARAIEGGELVLHFQPIVDLEHGRPAGLEALVRWQHPERGLLAPGEFIPLAEETGMIVALGRWVLSEACREASDWPGEPYVSVNVASAQLEQPGFVAEVDAALHAAGLAPERLTLEVTESSLIDDRDGIAEGLQALRALGVRLALDDFGTGYSSLSYLRRFPMDVLKIDRSFVRDVDAESALVRAIVAMGESLGLALVAEGIERAEQADVVRALGCGMGQGFLFSRPVPAAELRHNALACAPTGRAALTSPSR